MRRALRHRWVVGGRIVGGWMGVVVLATACNAERSDGVEPAPSNLVVDEFLSDAEATGTTDVSDDEPSKCWGSAPAQGDGIAFSGVAKQVGLVEPLTGMQGHAAAVGDVDADGWLDLFVGGFADRPVETYRVRGASGPTPDRLLLGGPDGFSVDTTFPGQLARTSGAVFADLTNDGRLEIVAVRNPRGDTEIGRRPTEIHQRTDTGWETAATLLGDLAGRAAAAVDIDRDGYLDLIVVADRWGGGSTRVLRNLGGGGATGSLEFDDVTSEWGLPDDMTGLALATVDLDADGWIDVVVSGDDRVLLGGPDGFRVERHEVFAWKVFGDEDDAAGIAVADLDGDGRPDLVVGQHFNSTLDFDERVPVRIFLNRSDDEGLRLLDATDAVGSPGLWTKSPHVAVVDVDNDGWPDIVTSAAAADGRPLVLRSSGPAADGIPRLSPVGEPGDGRYWVTGTEMDIDRDGRVDGFFVEWDPTFESPAFANTSGSGRWLHVDLAGTPGTAAGTRVEVFDPTSGDRLATGWVASTTGYSAGAAPIVRFGLGAGRDDVGVRVDVTPLGEPTETRTVPVNAHVRWSGC